MSATVSQGTVCGETREPDTNNRTLANLAFVEYYYLSVASETILI